MNGMAMRIILAICVLLPACAKEPEPVVVADLVRKDLFVVPLPDVPGAVPVDEHVESRIRIALDIDGMYVVKGRRVGPKELTQKLLVYADRKRDLDHPMQWSMVRALLAVHRDVTWGDLEGLLRIVADPDVRIRHAELLTWESEDGWKRRAVPLVLDSFQPGIARPVEPEVSLHVAPGASIDLYRRGLACVSAETIAKGIRVSIDSKTPVGEALRSLVVLARSGPPEIVLGKEDGSATGLAIGIPIQPLPDVPPETPVTIPLTLEVW